MIPFNVLSQVDLETFFEMFDMPDTYYSWWLVTELHAWMLCVRLSVGNSKGKKCKLQSRREVKFSALRTIVPIGLFHYSIICFCRGTVLSKSNGTDTLYRHGRKG